MMADAECLLEFLERGVGMFFDMGLKDLRIEFAPMPPALFGGEPSLARGGQIAVNRLPSQVKTPGRLNFGTARMDKLHHPFT